MRRVIFFLIAVALVLTGAWFLAGVPGHFSATIGSWTIETSAPIAIVALIVLIAVVLLVLRILVGLGAIPGAGAAAWRRSRVRSGETAVTRALVALAAGEQAAARKQGQRARKLLGESPQVLLLVAEASRMSGREDEADEAFRALASQKDARFLGLRGLLRQAVDRQDWTEALVLAKEAEAAHPGTAWLRQQRAELALQTDNWAEALDLVGADSRKAIYFTAAAEAEPDPYRALALAKKAWKQDHSFSPGVLAYARRLRASGNESRARSCVTEAWRLSPHPDLADFLLDAQPDKLARAQLAKKLVERNRTHPESRILLARTALDAGLTGEARHQTDAARAAGINQRRLWLMVAELEEQERGDTEEGRLAVRNALKQAASADPDPHWRCGTCYADQPAWTPKCPNCGTPASLQWVGESGTASVPAIVG